MGTLGPLIAPWTERVGAGRPEDHPGRQVHLRAKIADHWRRGNTFLLGDAAPDSAVRGQGSLRGIAGRDEPGLETHAGVVNGTLDPAVLDTYEQERKPHARSMIDLALMVGRAMTSEAERGDLLRGIVVPRTTTAAGIAEESAGLRDSRTVSWPPGSGAQQAHQESSARTRGRRTAGVSTRYSETAGR